MTEVCYINTRICIFKNKSVLSNADLLDVQIKIAMISVAKKVIVLANHRRVGQVHFAPAAPIAAVHKLVIGHGISPEEVKAFEEKGIEVIIAK